jgi:hypothetical protein
MIHTHHFIRLARRVSPGCFLVKGNIRLEPGQPLAMLEPGFCLDATGFQLHFTALIVVVLLFIVWFVTYSSRLSWLLVFGLVAGVLELWVFLLTSYA